MIWQKKVSPKARKAELTNYSDIDFARLYSTMWLCHATYERYLPKQYKNNQTFANFRYEDILSDDRNEHCRLWYNDDEVIACFEGTYSKNRSHSKRNGDYGRKHPFLIGEPQMVPSPFTSGSKAHPGFMKTLFSVDSDEHQCFADKVAKRIVELEKGRDVSIAGYSSGGALALLMASYMSENHPEIEIQHINTFGTPRMASEAFHDDISKKFPEKYIRTEIYGDPVTGWMRYEKPHYVHGGRQIVLTLDGKLLPSCKESDYPRDSYSSAMTGLLDVMSLKLKRNPRYADKYHKTTAYLNALGIIETQTEPQRADLAQEQERLQEDMKQTSGRIAALSAFDRSVSQEDIYNTSLFWFTHLRHGFEGRIQNLNATEDEKEDLRYKLQRFSDVLGNFKDPAPAEIWLMKCVDSLTEFLETFQEFTYLQADEISKIEHGMTRIAEALESAMIKYKQGSATNSTKRA